AVTGAVLVGLLVLAGVLAPWLTPYDPVRQDLRAVLQAPSAAHPLGTDQLGRDILARILHGARLTLSIGAFAVAVGLVVGVPLGCPRLPPRRSSPPVSAPPRRPHVRASPCRAGGGGGAAPAAAWAARRPGRGWPRSSSPASPRPPHDPPATRTGSVRRGAALK